MLGELPQPDSQAGDGNAARLDVESPSHPQLEMSAELAQPTWLGACVVMGLPLMKERQRRRPRALRVEG
jgi:hypothetical protein